MFSENQYSLIRLISCRATFFTAVCMMFLGTACFKNKNVLSAGAPEVAGILTYNYNIFLTDYDLRSELFYEEVRKYNPKLIALQETLPEAFRTLKLKMIETYPFYVYENKLAVFSQNPIKDYKFYSFRNRTRHDKSYKRGYLVVDTKILDKDVTVVNTHLTYRLKDKKLRKAQLKEILTKVRRRNGTKRVPLFVAGDLNAASPSEDSGLISAFKNIAKLAGYTDLALVDTYRLLNPFEAGHTWSDSNLLAQLEEEPSRRTDFILVLQNGQFQPLGSQVVLDEPWYELPYRFLSDHYGVYSEFTRIGE